MRILHVCHSDASGGAAIAARRLARAQRAQGGDARMLVLRKMGSEDWIDESSPRVRRRARAARFFAKRAAQLFAHEDRAAMRTLALAETGFGHEIAARAPDLVHWHWVGAEAVSLGEMARVGIPAVWTCHDEWAFAGAEHYALGEPWRDGYGSRGALDCDRWTFARKREAWRDWAPALICPSEWMARRARSSPLGQGRAVCTIANTLDLDTFRPRDRGAARRKLGLPDTGPVVLFGAERGTADPRKGFDLLAEALASLSAGDLKDVHLVTFGSGKGPAALAGHASTALGPIDDPARLAAVYSAADVFVAPSRQDNLPNTMLEAQACGTPCVGFAVGGLTDIVTAPHHGTLVEPFDTAALGRAVLAHARTAAQREAVRAHATARFGNAAVVARHAELYAKVVSR